ncbi:LysR substrate-binding domain-containing protein [Stenotrophomonas sp. 24(2023)]|uniref:LysR substrate-binding domain-containing protein n=1 Tax=Stenotrophomonas sp. 24(2023) TaxID=3068324 RepID=UPI0027E0D08A|nr:LysR substrate-binding domain-containing protein [Stenotrophomonas sp. 24(2023)]WMJ68721.1 LysR substrate-binding domain-containing protein [Stenotrophomonas sp. 24(2023)]
MDDTSLDLLRTVAAELSITRAAERLGRAPSNVTTRIQQLEAELGVELFIRHGKRLALSAQGERFLDYAQRLLALAEEARQSLHAERPSGLLRIGTMESAAASRLPVPLARFHARWPQVRLEVSTGPTAQLLERLRQQTIDCALVSLPAAIAAAPLADTGLQSQPVFEEQMLLVLPATHPPVSSPRAVQAGSLAAFAAGCSYRAFAEQWLAEGGQRLDVQVVGSYHAMLACVAAGTSACVMPRSVLALCPGAQLRTLELGTLATQLVWRSGYATPALDTLRDTLANA